jgi:hypothetical protein
LTKVGPYFWPAFFFNFSGAWFNAFLQHRYTLLL